MSSPAVSVIVPARDAAVTLPALLDALAEQADVRGFEVLVVDDGSRDTTAAIAAAHPVVDLVLAGAGAGPGAARNVALALARAPVLAFTDSDCVPAPGWLAAGLRAMESADLVQGRVVAASPCGPWDRTVRVEGLSGLWETANLFTRTADVRAVGGFEPWLRPRGSKELGEDVWLGWRLHRGGARAAFTPDALVAHAVVPRGPAGFVAERVRLRFFPIMVSRIPELRRALLWRGRFLTRRTAAFDLAALGLIAAAGTRRRRGAPVLLTLTLPYVRALRGASNGARPRRRVGRAAVQLAADGLGALALLVGSLRARRPVG